MHTVLQVASVLLTFVASILVNVEIYLGGKKE